MVQIPDEHMNLTYGDLETVSGLMGYEDVTLGGITVHQEVGLINRAAWFGDGVSSGMVGLAYSAM